MSRQGQCDGCDDVCDVTHYVDRDGTARMLCGRCLGHAVEVRAMHAVVEARVERLKAQQAQHRLLERQHQRAVELADAIRVQIEWAKGRLIDAEIDGDEAGAQAWHGYLNGLRWVESQLGSDRPIWASSVKIDEEE